MRFALLAGVVLIAALLLPAAEAEGALTATNVRIGSHAAFVRVVVDFSGGTVKVGEVEATDPAPANGDARLEVRRTGIQANTIDKTASGLRVRTSQGTGRVIVLITGAAHRFKYISEAEAHSPERLIFDVYRSRPPVSGAEIRTGRGGCLALSSVTASGRAFRVMGRERNLFEHSFLLRVRDASGKVVGRRVVTATGAFNLLVGYRGLPAQAGTVEAVAASAKDGSLQCLAQVRVRLRR